MLMSQKSGSSRKTCHSNPWVNSQRTNTHVHLHMCVNECVEATKYLRMSEDKSFSSDLNILIFHECLFDVVLNIHVFMLWRKRGNDAKNFS